jgi:hypothetical protein
LSVVTKHATTRPVGFPGRRNREFSIRSNSLLYSLAAGFATQFLSALVIPVRKGDVEAR